MPSGSADLDDLNKVWEVRPLKMPGEDEARRLLDSVAKQVQPIMRRRHWRVRLLSEFCPLNPSLLGLNEGGGAQVKLRLRRHNREWEFFPYEQILDTMLHELCHIEHGPHNADFYKLWDDIRKECEELMAKGKTGTGKGFDAPGRRLGGFSFAPPPPSVRQAALAAAERRARTQTLLPSGPKRLGGDSDIMVALSPIQAAAMAAERRVRDDLWCGSASFGAASAPQISVNGLCGPSFNRFGECSNNCTPSKTEVLKEEQSCDSIIGALGSSTSGLVHNQRPLGKEDPMFWECQICTLRNQPLSLICDACGTLKSKDVRTEFKSWSCKFCTLENGVEVDKCSACGQWRYSYGPPVSTRGPNVGT